MTSAALKVKNDVHDTQWPNPGRCMNTPLLEDQTIKPRLNVWGNSPHWKLLCWISQYTSTTLSYESYQPLLKGPSLLKPGWLDTNGWVSLQWKKTCLRTPVLIEFSRVRHRKKCRIIIQNCPWKNKLWEALDVTHDNKRRPTATETRVAYDNSTWHAMNTRYINPTEETSSKKDVPWWHNLLYPPFHAHSATRVCSI